MAATELEGVAASGASPGSRNAGRGWRQANERFVHGKAMPRPTLCNRNTHRAAHSRPNWRASQEKLSETQLGNRPRDESRKTRDIRSPFRRRLPSRRFAEDRLMNGTVFHRYHSQGLEGQVDAA